MTRLFCAASVAFVCLVVAAGATRVESAGAAQQDAQATAQFEARVGLARTLREAGRMREAAEAFRGARQLRPGDKALRLEAFWVEVDADPARGAALGAEILRDDPRAAAVRDRLIGVAATAGDETTVESLAREGERVDPGNPLWWRRQGESALRRGAADAAVTAIGRVVAQGSASDGDRALYAFALEAAGRPADAVNVWRSIPAATVAANGDWAAGRLRVTAAAAPLDVATQALESACPAAAGCDDMRAAVAARWRKSGRPDRALELLQPLLDGPKRARWLRLATDLAAAAGQTSLAVKYRSELVAAGGGSAEDVKTLLSWYANSSSPTGILDVAREARLTPCDERVLDALAQLSDTEPFLARVSDMPPTCSQWQARRYEAAGRLMGSKQFQRALDLLAPVLSQDEATPETRERVGQLLAWTGQWTDAIRVLEDLDPKASGRPAAADALIDAYRATGRARDAWALARWRLETSPAPDAARLTWAEIAVEAGAPAGALDLLASMEPTPAVETVQVRALTAMGEFQRVLPACDRLLAREFAARVALACGDAIDAIRGRADARAALRRYDAVVEAIEVHARRALWAALDGDTGEAATLRDRVDATSPPRARLLDAEVALGQGHPADALRALDLVSGSTWAARVLDLRSLALEASGAHADALAALARLRAQADTPWLELRQKEWDYGTARTPQSLDEALALTRTSLLRVPSREMAARLLLDRHDYARVRDTLDEVGDALSIEGRVTKARALRALGEARPALEAIRTAGLSSVADRTLRAQLLATVEGAAAANAEFSALATAQGTSPDTYLAWAQVVSGARREEVLHRGIERFPDAAHLWTALAASQLARGAAGDARTSATRALELDGGDLDAWLLAISSTARTQPSALPALVGAFQDRFQGDRSALVSAATRVGATVHDAADPLGRYAVEWLDRALGTPPDPLVRAARARVNAMRRQWDAALADIDAALADDPRNADLLKQRAEVLSYAGRHAEAVAAYDTYLAIAPADYAAARQQARVAAWGQDYESAARRYAALLEAHPADRALQYEARAKQAFYAGHWEDAIEAYDQWLAVEPEDSEAAFERAQALEQHGDAGGARAAWSALTARVPDHREASAAQHRFELAGRPAVLPAFAYQSANGYAGQRMLDVTESGAGALLPQGRSRAWTLLASINAVEAVGDGTRYHGSRMDGGVAFRMHDEVEVTGRVGAFSLGPADVTTVDATAAWSAREAWQVKSSVQRQPWLENAATVDAGLASTTWAAGVLGHWRDSRFEVAASRRWLTDGNAAWQVEGTGRRSLHRGRDEVTAVGWTAWQGFDSQVQGYFSPSSFFRADAGLEWRHWLALPRFADDLARYVTATYLFGIDNRGTVYHHPAVRGAWELTDVLLIEAGGDWIESSVYHQVQATVLLRVGGPVRR